MVFPVEQVYFGCLTAWSAELRKSLLFGPTDPLFPRPEMRKRNDA